MGISGQEGHGSPVSRRRYKQALVCAFLSECEARPGTYDVPWNLVSGEPSFHHYFLIGSHWRYVYLNVVVGRVVHYENALWVQIREDLVEPLQYRFVIHIHMIVTVTL